MGIVQIQVAVFPKNSAEKWFWRECNRSRFDVSHWWVRVVPKFGSEFADGWVESAGTTLCYPKSPRLEPCRKINYSAAEVR